MLPAPAPLAAQTFDNPPGYYLDQNNLPGVRSNPRPRGMERCVVQYERFYEGRYAVERMREVLICEDNGVTVRSLGPGAGNSPYGPPVGGYRGFGGADTR